MAEIVGVVRFVSTLDGRNLDREAEQAGQKAGKAGAKGYDKEWQQAFRRTLTKSGRESFDRWQRSGSRDGGVYGKVFSESLENYISRGMARAADSITRIRLQPGFLDDFRKGFDDAEAAIDDVNEQLRLMEGHLDGRVLRAARRQVDEWALAQRRAADETNRLRVAQESEAGVLQRLDQMVLAQHARARENLNRVIRDQEMITRMSETTTIRHSGALDRLERSTRAAAISTGGLNLQWRDLSHNTRQWTLIIGAIAAGLQDIAVLGAAAGAGLAAVGGAATSGILGIGGVAAVFATLSKDVGELPPYLRSVKVEFDRLKPVFGELREVVAAGAFSEMGGTFDQIGRNLRILNPELAELGRSVGRVFDDFADGTREGSAGLEEIRRALRLAGPNFESLAKTSGAFGTALLRTFNRAQPLVQDFLGYLDLLANRLDAFSRSNGLDEWLRNAQRTFGSLGPLLDATARMLNNLVTAESVNRTALFLDNLTAFMPSLESLLDILGSADLFGLLALALNEVGRAMAPLAPAVDALVTAFSGQLAVAIPAVADGLEAMAKIVAPLVQTLADFVAVIPPEVIYAAAAAVTALGTAFLVLRGVTGAIAAIEGFSAAAGAATTISGKLGNSLKAGLGKAGLAGAAIAGMGLLVAGVAAVTDEITQLDAKARNLVATNATLERSFKEMNPVDALGGVQDLDLALSRLSEVGTGATGALSNIGLAFSEGGSQALALAGTLKELDGPLSALANQSVAAASEKFAAWATEMDASEAEILAMINQMPGFKEALEQAALAEGQVASDANLVTLAMEGSTAATETQTGALRGVAAQAYLSEEAIADLADGIRGFSDEVYASRDAAREYEAAIDNLTDSIAVNGTTLDITTEQGRKNEQAIDDIAQATLENTAATLENTGKQEEARAVMEKGRQKLIEMLAQFDITGDAAEAYADELGLIPEDVLTDVELRGIQEAEAAIQRLIQRRRVIIQAAVEGGGYIPGVDRPFARGGTVYGPTRALIGEAGTEAVVPLERPLSQIDPSVRWLAAIAQGKMGPAMAGGGVAGVGGGYNIAEGAIVVEDRSGDPRRTGQEVLQRIIENVAG